MFNKINKKCNMSNVPYRTLSELTPNISHNPLISKKRWTLWDIIALNRHTKDSWLRVFYGLNFLLLDLTSLSLSLTRSWECSHDMAHSFVCKLFSNDGISVAKVLSRKGRCFTYILYLITVFSMPASAAIATIIAIWRFTVTKKKIPGRFIQFLSHIIQVFFNRFVML